MPWYFLFYLWSFMAPVQQPKYIPAPVMVAPAAAPPHVRSCVFREVPATKSSLAYFADICS